jgi:Tol biopolymer transport system component
MVRVVLRLLGIVVLLAGGVLAMTRADEPPVECVAYVVTYEDGSPIYRICPGDRTPRMVSKTSDYFRGVALSGDGKWFAFVVSGSFEDTLALMRIDGTGYREIFHAQGMSFPVWSPDNQWIALNLLGDGIFLIRPDGSDLHPLVGDSVLKWYVSTLSWSPDGEWIALCSDAGLYRLRPDGTGLQRLAPASGFLSAPMWSSDSQWIAYRYSSDQGGTEEEIRIIRADGSEVGKSLAALRT